MEVQQCSMCVVDGTCHCQQCNIIECCTKILLWQIHIAGDNRMYLGHHVKCPKFFPTLTKVFEFLGRFYVIRNINFHGNPSSESRALRADGRKGGRTEGRTDGRTDGRTEGQTEGRVKKLIGAFRDLRQHP